MNFEILKELKLRLGIEGDKYDSRLLSYIGEVLLRIESYCGVAIPRELFYTAVSMSVDLCRIELAHLPEIGDTINIGGGLKLRLGDAEISHGTGTRANANMGNTAKSTMDRLTLNYAHDLNRARRVQIV